VKSTFRRDLVIVTPARNEVSNIVELSKSLELQTFNPIMVWVIVDDGSSDGTFSTAMELSLPFKVQVLKREKEGKLITGAAFAAWWQGVDKGLEDNPDANYLMKLDADVVLDMDYFKNLYADMRPMDLGVIGGVISNIHREQKAYVPGPVKMYSRNGLNLIRNLPIATGFDVMDEMMCIQNGLNIQVISTAKFTMNRQIGHSQGLLHGRYRNGLVCKWVGYAPEYFALHVIRYLFRSPYLVGSIWMTMGYAFSNKGPYPQTLRKQHMKLQRLRLLRILRSPVESLRDLYL
jgi:dolichol-phosphate mannosyltransferase